MVAMQRQRAVTGSDLDGSGRRGDSTFLISFVAGFGDAAGDALDEGGGGADACWGEIA